MIKKRGRVVGLDVHPDSFDGAVVEEGGQVGAGALVPPGKVVPAGWLVMGVPAKPVRKMSPEELDDILRNATDYVELWHRDYRDLHGRRPV